MTTDPKTRRDPEFALQTMEVHSAWMRNFRTPENDEFFGIAFDYISACFGRPDAHQVLDAGCGSGTKSLELARRGYSVRGVDFSGAIIQEARLAVESRGLAERVQFEQGDLTALNIPSGSVRYVVCWGVLMHIPAVEKAIGELTRILAPGGILVISEGNMRSAQAVLLRGLKRLLRRNGADITRTATGIERWEETQSGRLMTRQADISWLISDIERRGLKLVRRRAGQFTELYTMLPWKPLRSLVHLWNQFWFRWIRWAGPAFGNIMVFVKPT